MRSSLLVVCVAAMCLSCSVDPKPAPSPAATLTHLAEPATAPPSPPTPAQAPAIDVAARDPFTMPVAPPPRREVRDGTPRKARKYSIDQLKLVGIVSGDDARAMLIDPRGKGWIVTRGDYVGRPDPIDEQLVGWRVQSIKTDALVFVRDDRALATTREAETRVVALHTTPSPADETSDVDD